MKTRATLYVIIICLVLLGALFLLKPTFTPRTEEQSAIDSCIASGGSYDVIKQQCQMTAIGSSSVPVSTSSSLATSSPFGTVLGIQVNSPKAGDQISSPLIVNGTAVGNWYFEATFPIVLTDWDGRVITQGQAHAQSDWMTSADVPFVATLAFPRQPTGSRGFLVLKNDNPSGSSTTAKSIEIPIFFK